MFRFEGKNGTKTVLSTEEKRMVRINNCARRAIAEKDSWWELMGISENSILEGRKLTETPHIPIVLLFQQVFDNAL